MTKNYHPVLPEFKDVMDLFSFWPSYKKLLKNGQIVDRICLDRFLLIRERLLDLQLNDCSVLDLGAGSGYFSWLLYLTLAKDVEVVENGRARQFGYGDSSFTNELKSKITQYKLTNLVVHDEALETFVEVNAGKRQWDVTICLSVLHHFVTGYGDDPSIGRLDYEHLLKLFKNLGAVTKNILIIELDPERIPNYEKFMIDLVGEGCFQSVNVLGTSHSSIGVGRNIMELHKHAD
jgi:hypothetical protein